MTGRVFAIMMRVATLAVMFLQGCAFGRAMLVHMEDADGEEHGEQAQHARPGRVVERIGLHHGMGQEVQQGDAQHQAAHQTHHQLHPGVRQVHQRWEPAAAKEATVSSEQ